MQFEQAVDFADYSLEEIRIDYADIQIVCAHEKKCVIRCVNFIAISYIGQWDENIIDEIFITRDDELIEESRRKVRQNNDITSAGGGTKNYDGQWLCLVVRLIDSVEIKIVCSDVEIEITE